MIKRDWFHWVARTVHRSTPFWNEEIAARYWHSLQDAFPGAGGAILMPNHLHILLDRTKPHEFDGILGALSRWHDIEWQPHPPPKPIADREHLLRNIRYVALNPTRAKIVEDPLLWRWSTLRDALGTTARPWAGPVKLAAECLNSGSRVRLLDYITNDETVSAAGRVLPRAPARPTDHPSQTLEDVARAVGAGLVRPGSELILRGSEFRHRFIWTAWTVGIRNTAAIGSACGTTDRAVRKVLARGDKPDLSAILTCLGERRFLHAGREAIGVTFQMAGRPSR